MEKMSQTLYEQSMNQMFCNVAHEASTVMKQATLVLVTRLNKTKRQLLRSFAENIEANYKKKLADTDPHDDHGLQKAFMERMAGHRAVTDVLGGNLVRKSGRRKLCWAHRTYWVGWVGHLRYLGIERQCKLTFNSYG